MINNIKTNIFLNQSKTQTNINFFFLKQIIFIFKSIKNILTTTNLICVFQNIEINNNKFFLKIAIFISSKKINFFKKYKKKNTQNNTEIAIIYFLNFLNKKLFLLRINLISFKIKNLNLEINKKFLIFLYKKNKKIANLFFEKRFFLFIDFLKLSSLFAFSKITIKSYLIILSQIFKRLHKKKQLKFIYFLKHFSAYFIKNSKTFGGIKFVFSGKLQGKSIASKVIILNGCMPSQTLKTNIFFASTDIFTKYGVYGLKAWLYKN